MRSALALAMVIGLALPTQAQPRPARVRPPEAIRDAPLDKSPLLSELQRKVRAGDAAALPAFWTAMAARGGPLVEPLADTPHYALITFVYRSAGAKSVVLVRPSGDERAPDALERLPGTDVWARSYVLRDDARLGYGFGVDFGSA